MSYVIKILAFAFAFSGCVAHQFITNKNEFKGSVFSKTITINANYQKLAHCVDSIIVDTPYLINIKTFDELGKIEWRASRASAHYIVAIIEFKKIHQDKTEAKLYSPFDKRHKDIKISLPFMENSLKDCEVAK